MTPKSYADQVLGLTVFDGTSIDEVLTDAAQIAGCADEAVKTLLSTLDNALDALAKASARIQSLEAEAADAYSRGFTAGYEKCYYDPAADV